MAEPKTQFGRFPAWVIRGGYLSKMSRSEICVFAVICIICGGNDWKGYASDKTLAELADVSTRTIERATKRLAGMGLVFIHRGKWRGTATAYQVRQKPDKTMSTFQENKARQNESQSSTFSSPKPDKMEHKARHSCVDPSDITDRTETTEKNCVDDSACEKEESVRVIAQRIGIKEPSLTAIAKSGITQQGLIAWAATAPENVGNLAGYLIGKVKRLGEGGEKPPAVTPEQVVKAANRKGWIKSIDGYQLQDDLKAKYNNEGVHINRGNIKQKTITPKQLQIVSLA